MKTFLISYNCLKDASMLTFKMDNYKYTQAWFINSEIHRYLRTFCDSTTERRMLEIGCFEGLSSVFLADNFLEHPKSTLTCVDPFLNVENNDHMIFLQNNEEGNFDYNTSICKYPEKIIIHKITSDSFFAERVEGIYDFIYIDGCHIPEFVTRDMENSFRVLACNGIMWMDDYGSVRPPMDEFLEKYKGKYELIHMGYQLAIRKIKNETD
jgi:predicted O-methyltransferase YrrM